MNDTLIKTTRPSGLVMLDRALDPVDRLVNVVAWPDRRVSSPILAGDIVIRQPLGGRPRSFILSGDVQATGHAEAEAVDIGSTLSGPDSLSLLRLFGADRLLMPDLTIIRALPEQAGWTGTRPFDEMLPPQPNTGRPTIRSGSRGSAVIEAQQRLNSVHANRIASSQSGLDRCPLSIDGIFGQNTRAATVAFQRIAFALLPNEWDGIIGPRTWTALIERSEQQVPVRPPIRPPVTPGGGGGLNPARWSGILSPLATGRANLRSGNAVRALVDGTETYNAMADDMGRTNGPRDFIYLLGWDNFDDFALGSASNFRDIYTAAARTRGVEVAAMLWDQPFLNWQAHLNASAIVARINALTNGKAIEDDLTTNNTLASRARLIAALTAARLNPRLIPVIIRLIEPDLARLGGSHHQKVLIVKRGETLVAYCGGIDMNPNRVRAVDANAGQPHHDTHCRIVGPSAHDLLSTFLSRWEHHPSSSRFGALRGATTPVPAAVTRPNAVDAPFGGPVSVLIARTFNPTRTIRPNVVTERSIKPLLLAAIAGARRFIYCEDQYLIDLDTANALAAVIPRLSHVTILIPGNLITDVPFGKEYRRDFVAQVEARIPAAHRSKFRVFQLSTSQSSPTFGDHTYVHSKSWVFDDELAVIGTANCNRRSYTFDSEVDAFIFEDARPEGSTRPTFAQQYRMGLWQHHLAASARAVSNGATSGSLWLAGSRPSGARVIEFDHRLPTGFFSTAGLRQAVMDRAANSLRDLIDPVP
jgi:phosphatidylserine/phosphatidylglycerophosphate/cardiolipin synthase-like enzyme